MGIIGKRLESDFSFEVSMDGKFDFPEERHPGRDLPL
jgi:hypothetical protein